MAPASGWRISRKMWPTHQPTNLTGRSNPATVLYIFILCTRNYYHLLFHVLWKTNIMKKEKRGNGAEENDRHWKSNQSDLCAICLLLKITNSHKILARKSTNSSKYSLNVTSYCSAHVTHYTSCYFCDNSLYNLCVTLCQFFATKHKSQR